MVEFVFAWTVKEVVKIGLFAFLGFLLLLFMTALLFFSLDVKKAEYKDAAFGDACSYFTRGVKIVAITEVGILLLAYIARYFYWVIVIW